MTIKKILLTTHMHKLLSCSQIVKASASEINRLLSMINAVMRSFRSLGRPVEHWDDWFVHTS